MTKDAMDPDLMLKKVRGEDVDEEEGLLPSTHVFDVDYEIKEGPRRGQKLKGRFEYQVPAAGKQIEIARLKAMYLPQGATSDPNGALLVEMISYLSCTLTKKPNWWKPTTFYDTGVISVVYQEATSYEARFLGKSAFVQANAEGLQEQAEDAEAVGDDGEGLVDGNVPSSRKRREVLTTDSAGGT